MTESKVEKRISLRVSPELYEMMLVSARERNLSINGYIIRALENAEFDKLLERRLEEVEAFIIELKRERGELE